VAFKADRSWNINLEMTDSKYQPVVESADNFVIRDSPHLSEMRIKARGSDDSPM
jgi:hypothetical protein